MPLNIIIAGAGIAGFSAAISCRRAGHNVQIYERSSQNNEVGAAIHVSPNASRGLLAWGLDPVRARFITVKSVLRADGRTLERFDESDEAYVEPTFGAPWFLAHRVDFHEELRLLATQEQGAGKPALVHLSSKVTSYDPDGGSITLSDGSVVRGDLVIAADGVHSGAVEAVLGYPSPALSTPNLAYRFLIPSHKISQDIKIAHFDDADDGCMKFLIADDHRLIWYPCRNNEIQNFNAIFHTDDIPSEEDSHRKVDKSLLLKRYADFHPSVLAVMAKASEIMQWPLLFRAPIPSWHKGRLVLIGDAAHPMLPHQGQGGGQAIEDAVSLGILLTNCRKDLAETTQRLRLFEKMRMNRASVITMFSNAGQDQPEKILADAAKYIGIENVPKSPRDFSSYNFGYDVVSDSIQVMMEAFPGWQLPRSFFEKEPGRGVYP